MSLKPHQASKCYVYVLCRVSSLCPEIGLVGRPLNALQAYTWLQKGSYEARPV